MPSSMSAKEKLWVPPKRIPGPPKPPRPGIKRVFVCSPLRPRMGWTLEQNIELARKLCVAAVRAGVAPFAPHVFYLGIGLDDFTPRDREAGIAAGLRWLAVSDELWAFAESYDDCTEEMRLEVDKAQTFNVPVKVVYLPECWRELWGQRGR